MFKADIYITDGLIDKVALQCQVGTTPSWQFISDSPQVSDLAKEWLEQYLEGRQPSIELPLNHSLLTSFQTLVYQETRKIPAGTTLTYKEIAGLIGHPGASRAVGSALGKNPFLLIMPCHRVIGSTGKLCGFAAGLELKARLLEFEKKF